MLEMYVFVKYCITQQSHEIINLLQTKNGLLLTIIGGDHWESV